MRLPVALRVVVSASLAAPAACGPAAPTVNWACDFDASESRPLSMPDASTGPDGSLPASVCETTCGAPVHACAATTLDGGVAGAVCPVCTF